MLEQLTREQEALMSKVAEEWISFALESHEPMDRNTAKEGIEWMYRMAKLKPPQIIYTQSPLACQIAANLCQVRNSVWDSVWASVRDNVWDSLKDSLKDSVWASVRDNVWDSVGDSVWASVGASVWDSVRASVRDNVGDSVRDSVGASNFEYFYPACRDILYEAEWVAFYDYFARIGVLDDVENFNRYKKYLKSGVFYAIFLDGLAIVCGRPAYFDRDTAGRLHSENRPAVLWHDGFRQYFWHGVSVPAKLIEAPEELTREDLMNEPNAEVRRAYMERLGTGRFCQLLDLEEVDRDKVGQGVYVKEYTLYRTKTPDPAAGEYVQFVNVICHSTEREYMLCVLPDIRDVWSAVAWTFGKDKSVALLNYYV